MKAHDLASLIELEGSLRERQPAALRDIVEIFRSAPATATAAAVIKKIRPCATDDLRASTGTFSETLENLKSVARITQLVASKAGAAAGAALLSFAEEYSDISVQALASRLRSPPPANHAATLNEEAVQRHSSELLRRAPGTHGFGEALQSLKADKAVKPQEMRAIAATLGVKVLDTATRGVVLKKIAREHTIIETTAAKAKALRGNSSA